MQIDSSRPKISVIVSLYNAGKFIRGFMENVMEQARLEEMEILLLDAQSADETAAVIAEYNHPSLRYILLESRLSIYEAWNYGISVAQADILTNWNADDRRRSDSMWAQYALFEDPGVDISYGATAWSYRENERFEENLLTEIYPCYNVSIHSMMANNSPHCMPMWRKNLHDRFGLFDPRYPTAADFDFWLRCLAGGAKFKRVDEIVGLYYHNPNGLSTHSQTSNMREGAEIKQNYAYLY